LSYPPDRRTLRKLIESLAIFDNVLDDPIGRAARTLAIEPAHAPAARLVALLAEDAEMYPEQLVGDAWQNHLLDRLLAADNVFSRKAEREPLAAMGERLLDQVRHELEMLQALYYQGSPVLAAEAHSTLGDVRGPNWAGHQPVAKGPALHTDRALDVKRQLAASTNWPGLLDALAGVYAESGIGDFSRFHAFRWIRTRDGEHGRLEGIAHPDPIQLSDLVGYEQEREPAVRNAERFAAGYPANNALLYGERGTGKSSTVKAILNAFADRGLRLIDVPKEHLLDLPQILALIRERKQRFILFVDDLSFEEHETWYKPLKAVLEGSVETKPENVIVYATSNRRHVVHERFGDRDFDPDDDVHSMDTLDEKLSLSDRFGLRVWFGGPDQDLYLRIVDALARRDDLRIGMEDLHRRALVWAERHNGRSGRTARQFIDALTGELALP
jgi:predicted AAA+ superfamily ATPase